MKVLKPARFLGPEWWVGLLVGLFVAALLVETEALPSSSPAWKFIRGGSVLGVALTTIVGRWGMRRAQAESLKDLSSLP